jgi:hypothetical protein
MPVNMDSGTQTPEDTTMTDQPVRSTVGHTSGPMFGDGPSQSQSTALKANDLDHYLTNTTFTRDTVRRIGRCSGNNPVETLKWMRAVSECTRDQKAVMIETSEGPLREFLDLK